MGIYFDPFASNDGYTKVGNALADTSSLPLFSTNKDARKNSKDTEDRGVKSSPEGMAAEEKNPVKAKVDRSEPADFKVFGSLDDIADWDVAASGNDKKPLDDIADWDVPASGNDRKPLDDIADWDVLPDGRGPSSEPARDPDQDAGSQPGKAENPLDHLDRKAGVHEAGRKIDKNGSSNAVIRDENTIQIERKEPENRHHHHHHRHKKSLYRRIRHYYRKHQSTLAVILLLLILALFAGGFFVYRRTKVQKRQHISSTHSYDMGSGYRVVYHNGKKYRYNNLITTVLYAGLDSTGEMRTYGTAGEAPRADTINLAVLDKKNKKMSVISISRYTLTRIRRYTMFLTSSDYYVGLLCYSFPFGDGGKLSCQNLTESVSNLLGIPIDEYVVSNMDSMTYINDIVGGVDVTVPNDDLLEKLGVEKGSRITITDDNVMAYLRTRDIHTYFSNDGRLERQKSYILAYVEKLRQMLPEHRDEVWEKLEDMDRYMLTSVTKNKYIQYAKLLKSIDFSVENYYNLPGYNQRGDYYDEFVPDEEGIRELILDLCYEPA